MSARIYSHLDLTYLKRQAKKLQQDVRSGEPAALLRVEQNLPHQRRQVLKSSKAVFGQRDALLVIAREYGFSSWAKLKADVNRSVLDGHPLPDGMKRIFANLYRFDGKPRGKSRTVHYSYLIVRKQGNLLICNKYAPIMDYMDEIDALGGIHTQLIARYLDASPRGYHDKIHEFFDAQLCYHEDERKMTRTRTKCPEITFGDQGLKIDTDFEAHLFPNKGHTGTCVFRWRNRGKYYLFTGGAVRAKGADWHLRFDPQLWPEKRALFDKLLNLKADYILPGGSGELEEDIYQLTDRSRKSFGMAIQAKLEPRQGGIKTGVHPDKLRVVTNYVSQNFIAYLNDTDLFEADKMKVHGNCSLSLLQTYLEGADVMFLNDFRRKFRPDHMFLSALREHVEKGGGLLLTESRRAVGDQEIAACHPFPEIGVMGKSVSDLGEDIPELVVGGQHPIVNELAEGTRFAVSVFTHHDHSHIAYEGSTFEPGPEGQVLVRNAFGDPVVLAGQVGKGRVVFVGFHYSRGTDVGSVDHHIYENALRWLGVV